MSKLTNLEKRKLVERYQNGETIRVISMETGVAQSTLYSWAKPYNTTITKTGVIVTPKEFDSLKRRSEKLEGIVEVLKVVNCTVQSSLKDKLNALETLYGQYSVHVLCEALDVPRGTFYNHIFRNKKENNSYQIRRDRLSEQIKQVYDESNQIYGPQKIKAIMTERGIVAGDKMVAELMCEMNLYSIRTNAKKNYCRFNSEKIKDSLKMNFSVNSPNQVWVSDVTYFKLNGKFYYICAIIDLYSRKVIAHKISEKHSTQLISATFKQAYKDRQPDEGLTFHSDRGSQYTSHSFQSLLKTLRITQSFSPSGKPHHNAVMESFFSSMKKEELYRTNYRSASEFKKRVKAYIDFYNIERPHATLGYKAPNTYEHFFSEKKDCTQN